MATSRLEQSLADVETGVLALLTGVAFAFGARHIEAQDKPAPRVVWVRTGGVFDAPADAGTEGDAVATRGAVVVAHCWAVAAPADELDTDDAAAERLVDAVIAALLDRLGTSVVLGGEEWLETGHTSRGATCLLSFTVLQPVTRLAPRGDLTTVTVEDTDFDTDNAVAGDGELHAGES